MSSIRLPSVVGAAFTIINNGSNPIDVYALDNERIGVLPPGEQWYSEGAAQPLMVLRIPDDGIAGEWLLLFPEMQLFHFAAPGIVSRHVGLNEDDEALLLEDSLAIQLLAVVLDGNLDAGPMLADRLEELGDTRAGVVRERLPLNRWHNLDRIFKRPCGLARAKISPLDTFIFRHIDSP